VGLQGAQANTGLGVVLGSVLTELVVSLKVWLVRTVSGADLKLIEFSLCLS